MPVYQVVVHTGTGEGEGLCCERCADSLVFEVQGCTGSFDSGNCKRCHSNSAGNAVDAWRTAAIAYAAARGVPPVTARSATDLGTALSQLLSSFQAWTYTAAGQLAFWGCTGTLTQPLSMAQLAALMTKVAPFTSVMFFACVSCLV
jgi:hypothetical protein